MARRKGSCSVIFLLLILSAFKVIVTDRSIFYEVLSGKSEANIDRELSRLNTEKSTSLVNAFKGALQMKKAGFVKGAGNKVKMFKNGALLLEEEIKSNPKNVEYRFIRLSIQENAPKILKYNKNLNEDKKLIIEGFKKLDPELQKVIKNYAEGSDFLKIDNF
ncbi:hypothetical protein [Dyadobacter sp. CY312]|uniref:hypothetical protein n=1 Tax=Dyadobacter sp. CY312 TaxID=2907303 RepID=UPI001F1E8EE0|nr:hypothetical protein [Dyadobacter sp. CY312]MCE7041581.1 hypothetical protein [Dyadobacter sp. CY312]